MTERGHNVTLFEKDTVIGGQFNMAKVSSCIKICHLISGWDPQVVPGKEEFHETIRYFNKKLQLTGNCFVERYVGLVAF